MSTHRKNILIILSIALIGFATAIFFLVRPSPIKNIHSDGQTIIALGDSLFQGVGASDNNDLVTKLASYINEPIINMGVSGDTTAMALARIDDALALHPKIVIVLLGGNDFLRHVPLDETFKNLDTIITKIQGEGAAVLLLGVRGGILSDPFSEPFKEMAKTRGTGFVSNVLSGLIGNSKYMSPDQIHPNDAGYELIAKKVAPVLQDMLQENAKK